MKAGWKQLLGGIVLFSAASSQEQTAVQNAQFLTDSYHADAVGTQRFRG
jgi:hypothetical protein